MVRKIAGSEVSTRDLNLDGSYYLLFGRGMIQSAGFLSTHDFGDGVPRVSNSKVNPTSGRVDFGSTSDGRNPQISTIAKKSKVKSTNKPKEVFGKVSFGGNSDNNSTHKYSLKSR